LVITTDNGVRLRPADGDRVEVDRRMHSHWSHRSDTWVLDLSCPEPKADAAQCPRKPEVDIAADSSVTVTARNAGIDAAGVSASLDLSTVDGDVTVTRSGGRDATVRLVARNGSARAETMRARRVHAQTVNGDAVLSCATSPSGVTAATGNGSVRVHRAQERSRLRVSAATDNGRRTVALPASGAADDRTMTLTTVNGDVTAAQE
jgi:DUF4097 and DUF4098 domain-containing protein YvlB